ncbi:MAG: hypothetical protein ACHQ4F_16065 [Candidatus Dormibacteria bacterium]
MTGSTSRWIPLTALAFAATLVACGSTTTSPTTSAPGATPTAAAATPTASAASVVCPSGATVGSALGTTLPDATGVTGGGGELPAGVTGAVCDYHTATENVIIEVLVNINPSIISQFTRNFPGGVKSVSGLGDQATSFYVTLGTGKDNEGVVATKGSTLVSIGATATPASLSQVEALVNSLL